MAEGKKILSVSELTFLIKKELETSFINIWVEGEISNLKQHTSGHIYFSLKDASSQISCTLWRTRAQPFVHFLEDGLKVHVVGSVTVYPPRGSYQLDVVRVVPVGIGELQIAFERLKKRLADEGLFDPEKKKMIPRFPETIGIITSETGAALKDIMNVLERRYPLVNVQLFPVRVQGIGAAGEIADAIRDANRKKQADVLIVGRGGGSLEDLWPFNEEKVARAIYASKIPIVSAVGHEIDFTISDFVADLRAPTPSAAAELVVPDRTELLANLANICYTIQQNVEEIIDRNSLSIRGLVNSYSFNYPKQTVLHYTQRLDELERTLGSVLEHYSDRSENRLISLRKRLESVGPKNILRRGYALVRKDMSIVRSSHELKPDDHAVIEFHDGEVPAKVESK